ncbi:MAG TPA: MFS transporter [Bacteroidales bacterium]|nr:MFS transporter [Bacteroidales bacterium]
MSQSNNTGAPFLVRWVILIIISVAMMGNYYIYDSISPLADMLKVQLGFSSTAIGTLNAIYSIPNIFMVLIGGIIIDKIGVRKAGLIFTALIMFGAVITCLKGSLIVMATGRLIFGLGAESMIVAITTSIARWFKGKEFSFAFGINLTVARLGSFLALNSPNWAASFYAKGWQFPLFIAAIAGIAAVICMVVFYFADGIAGKRYHLPKEGNQDKIEWKAIFKFSTSFWFISMLCIVFYSAMFPFQTFAVMFFEHSYNLDNGAGGLLSSMLTLAAMIFTPIFGYLSDLVGRRSLFMIIGSLMIIPLYLMLGYHVDLVSALHLSSTWHVSIKILSIDAFISPNVLIPMFVMGLAFAMIPALMWPSVALVVDNSKLGTAYGLMTMIQNIGLVGFNLLIGVVNDHFQAGAGNPDGYIPGMWLFSMCGVLGIVFSFLLRKSAKTEKGVTLDLPMRKK